MMTISIKNLSFKSIKSLSLPFNLQKREKIIVGIAGALLFIFILAHVFIYPVLNHRDSLKRQIVSRSLALQEMQQLKTEYVTLTRNAHSNAVQLKARPQGFTLFSFLDTLAGQSGIKQNIDYMKPSTSNLKNSSYSLSMVELKINALTMEQLVNFMHGVETSPNLIWIKRISIDRGEKENDLINSVLQVETFQ
jgi:general secretion pathway protein M